MTLKCVEITAIHQRAGISRDLYSDMKRCSVVLQESRDGVIEVTNSRDILSVSNIFREIYSCEIYCACNIELQLCIFRYYIARFN